MSAESAEVVVVGAGVGGCAIAHDLAADYDVLALDKGQVAGEASGLAAGLVAPTLFHADAPDVARHANAFFREFDGTDRFSFTERPRTELIPPDDEHAARDRADRLSGQGFPVTFIDAAEAEEAYPMFDLDGFAGVVEYGDAGWLDPYSYTVSLRTAAADRGATFETRRVRGVAVEDGAVAGVETDSGTVRAPTVVCAAGWRTRDLMADHATLPVRPFRLQCAILDPGWDLDESFPLGRVVGGDLYFRPEHNGDLLVGGGEYAEPTPERRAGGGGIDDDFRRHVAGLVPSFLRDFDRAGLVDGWSGVDAATPDTRPIIDALGRRPGGSRTSSDAPVGPDGLVVATGFNGLGMVNSPVAAAAARALVTGEDAPFDVDRFSLGRFDDPGADFDVRGTFAADPEET